MAENRPSINDILDGPTLFCVRRHLRFGWWSLLVFLTLGIALEAMHGFKIGWYLDVSNATRRLMWTLAHTHGTLLALVHIAFAATVPFLAKRERPRRWVSGCLYGASVLLPGGFFIGGIVVHGGDPNLGILLLPVGVALLFVGVLITALLTGGRSLKPTDREG